MSDKILPQPENVVRLQPIVMVVPTREYIYAPSRLSPVREKPYTEFLERYADHARVIKVSFADDGKSDPQLVTAYSCGLNCWYIL